MACQQLQDMDMASPGRKPSFHGHYHRIKYCGIGAQASWLSADGTRGAAPSVQRRDPANHATTSLQLSVVYRCASRRHVKPIRISLCCLFALPAGPRRRLLSTTKYIVQVYIPHSTLLAFSPCAVGSRPRRPCTWFRPSWRCAIAFRLAISNRHPRHWLPRQSNSTKRHAVRRCMSTIGDAVTTLCIGRVPRLH